MTRSKTVELRRGSANHNQLSTKRECVRAGNRLLVLQSKDEIKESKMRGTVRGTPLTVGAALTDSSADEYDEAIMRRLAQLDADEAEASAPRRIAQEARLRLAADPRINYPRLSDQPP